MKFDIICWSKYGMPNVTLKRINQVIPPHAVNRKIMVSDSEDEITDYSYKKYAWRLVLNEFDHNISGAANTGLQNVETDVFMTLEDDLFLSADWWTKIPRLFANPKVAVASGVRFALQPAYLRALQKYVYLKYLREAKNMSAWLRHRQMSGFTLGKTLDNTLWRTDFLRNVGGFPYLKSNTGIDVVMAYKVHSEGYYWIVDYDVESTHLRKAGSVGLKQELRHADWYGSGVLESWREIRKQAAMEPPVTMWGLIQRTIMAIGTGFFVALKTKQPSLFLVHPLIRLFYLKGVMRGRRFV